MKIQLKWMSRAVHHHHIYGEALAMSRCHAILWPILSSRFMAIHLWCNYSYVKYCLVKAQAILFGFGFSIWCYFHSQARFSTSSHCLVLSSYGIWYSMVLWCHAVPWASFIDWNTAVLLWLSTITVQCAPLWMPVGMKYCMKELPGRNEARISAWKSSPKT